MVNGWNKINNEWYYFYNDGSMAKSTNIEGYKINEYGKLV